MKLKRPKRLGAVLIYTILKVIFLILAIGIYYFTKDIDPNVLNLTTGVRDGIVESFNLTSDDTNYEFGRLVGKLFFPIILAAFTLIFILKRKFWPTIIAVVLDILTGFGSGGLPIFTIAMLLVILTKPARNYLKNIDLFEPTEILDDGVY